MTLVACKECRKEISKKAAGCPHCGYKPRRTSALTWLITLVGIPAFLAIVVGQGSSRSSSPPASSSPAVQSPEDLAAERKSLDNSRESYARIIAEQAITKRLKATSTADFSGYSDTHVGPLKNGGPDHWVVRGYVDAQNSFGAKIRNNYQVVIEFEPGKYDSSRVLKADIY